MAREQRFVFGEVAETYDRVRPGYPAAVAAAIATTTGPVGRAVEIGAGTGKATTLLAPHCGHLLALEPSAAMAEVAARVCRHLDNVEVITSTFEAWEPDVDAPAIDLIASAQAWHWVDHAVGIPKARGLLRLGGVLALFWNAPIAERTTHHDAIEAVYSRIAPGLDDLKPWQETTASDMAELQAATGLEVLGREDFDHEMTYLKDEYLDLMRTQSNHRLLADDHLARLLDGLDEALTAAGGPVTVPYQTMLVMARRTA